MLLVASGFFLILGLTFGLVLMVSAPSKGDKAVQQRLTAIAVGKSSIQDPVMEAAQLLRKTASSRFDWINQYFSLQKLQRWIGQAAIDTTASAFIVQTLALGAIGLLIALIFVPMLATELAGACVVGALPWTRIAIARSRRIGAFNKALPHSVDMMSRSLRAGHSTAAAIEIMAQGSPEPAASEFAEVFRQQNFGLPLRDALMQLLDRVPSPDLRVLVTAINVQRETGGNLVEVLDRTVFVIRERQRIQGEIRTQTAQGRMTGWILTLLPVILMGLINFMDPGYSRVLFTDPTGHLLLYGAAALIGLGAFIINRIINGIDV